VSAFTGGPFEGLEDDSESESDADEDDEDVLPVASICSHSGGEGRKRSVFELRCGASTATSLWKW